MPPAHSRTTTLTIGRMMGLVALFGLGFALLKSPAAPLGAGILVVIPGYALDRSRGGPGIVGGVISGCLLSVGAVLSWILIEALHRTFTLPEALDLFPSVFLVFVASLIWSGVVSGLLYVADRALPTRTRPSSALSPSAPAPRPIDAGIRFLPEDNRPAVARVSRPSPARPVIDSKKGTN